MSNLTIEDLLKVIRSYDLFAEEMVRQAYEYADSHHRGQVRQSGEPYISHPLNVAYILAEMHADCNTICAGLLHDTLEDTDATKKEITELFNEEVANLVDGVTKLAKMNFSSKKEQQSANTRKIITGITNDVRIIIIKLADRLHNMRTLQFKSRYKQIENAIETIDVFVPFAYYIGAYRIKSELEDLSLRYLKPDRYKELEDIQTKTEEDSRKCLQEMLFKISRILNDRNIPHEIKVRTKNIYGMYKRLEEGRKLDDMHDLLSLKIMVEEIDDCYRTLGLIHSLYKPINYRFKDYICNPKTNMYQSLHTTVFGPNDRLAQTQIRTFDMDTIASFGLTAYWFINKGDARTIMQKDLRDKFQFFNSLTEIDKSFGDNQQFIEQVKGELFAEKIYVYTTKGDVIELPKGATVIDFAYQIHTAIGNKMVGAYVNDVEVPVTYQLQNKDRVRIVTDELSKGPQEEWFDRAVTSRAKTRIRKYTRIHQIIGNKM